MPSMQSGVMHVARSRGSDKPTLAQKTFTRLIRKINDQRRLLDAWQAIIAQYRQQYDSTFVPLRDSFAQCRMQMAQLLDRAHDSPGMTKPAKSKLRRMIFDMVDDVITGDSETALKLLHQKYRTTDVNDDIAVADAAAQQMQALMAELLATMSDGPTPPQIDGGYAEAQDASQSIRDLYRKLVSALHPDREQDPAEYVRKTGLMQQVNVAYRNRDVFQLLELQLDAGHRGQHRLDTLSDKRLAHYNAVLTGQSLKMEDDITCLKVDFMMRCDLPPGQLHRLRPDNLLQHLRLDISAMQQCIARIEKDLIDFADLRQLKAYLKTLRLPRQPVFDADLSW
ncbi:J domain-containing protein [Actimicrobium sp. CCC2.4]|uniref:J domain-containing protein n=1 Tax=Actimicrobium sp. CCC2.4 TaxID=3048606 RepID=UPI002AC90788|nr:J domain-containing protein [Actimicrobium sp. CCC2.4]MEB0134107.1 J domain-containing protein [Actimicrobium sp. CCC2.4]WPX31637.1 J domain-containing protein [Actimicrobium sp. CCC2.4]